MEPGVGAETKEIDDPTPDCLGARSRGRCERAGGRCEAVVCNDWQKLDNKIKSSIVEGVSVFLSMFDMPDVAAVFCPPPPEISDDPRRIGPKARAAMLAEKKPRLRASVRTAPNGPPIPLPKGRAIYRRSMN